MKVMTGLMKPDSGDVKIFGKSVRYEFVEAMREVGCIIETAESYTYLSANENLKLLARFYPDVDQQRIDECLKLTGLFHISMRRHAGFP